MVSIASSWGCANLNEVAQAIYDFLDGKEPMIPGPDFPTGGLVINANDFPFIMRSGKGSIKIRAQYKIEGNKIIFYEIPYGTTIENLLEEIGSACDSGEINDVVDIKDESNKKVRIVIECNKKANKEFIVKQLFAKTKLQTSFSYNQVALINKVPTLLNLKQAIEIYVNHNKECIVREASFDLKKANDRKEIVEGLLKALEDIDNIIKLIKASKSSIDAKNNLISIYGFTDNQAKAIIDMKLGRLAHLEYVELNQEKAELTDKINELNILVQSEDKQIEEIKNRLSVIVKKYGDKRRTQLTNIASEPKEEVLIEPKECIVVLTKNNYVKRIPKESFRVQKRNTKGIKSQEDITAMTLRTNTIDSLMVFTNKGVMYRLPVDNIPEGTNAAKGTSIKNLLELSYGEEPQTIYSLNKETTAKYVLFITKNGYIKKTSIDEYNKTKKKGGLIAIKLKEDDALSAVTLIDKEDLVIITKNGMGIKIKSSDITPSGRSTIGVKAIKLSKDDKVLTVLPVRNPNDSLAIFSEDGLGYMMNLNDLMIQTRGGRGLILYKKLIAAAALVEDNDELFISGTKRSVCISAKDIPKRQRGSNGNIIIKDDNITSVTKI